MTGNKKIFLKTGYFLQELGRSRIIVQAVLAGLISGGLVVLFKVSISGLFEIIRNFVEPMSFCQRLWMFPLITTLGGLVSGLLVCKFAPETKGSGIPYVKMTLARMGNITRLRSILVKFFAGVAGIGTGLSLGREGPSVQLGAGAGALVGRLFKMKGTDQHNLIAAGAGSAIGATFNAPVAGAVFVLEELVNNFSASLLFPVLVATVCAASLARYFLGSNPSFTIPAVPAAAAFELIPVCIILGIIAGILGVLFARIIFWNNRLFDGMSRVPDFVKPAIAGFAVGIIGLFLPYILGSGNLSVDMLLQHKFSAGMIIVIFFGKFILTPFCFGSGAAGGIFLPMLMLGAFLGYITGDLASLAGFSVNPVLTALVGMGAFLSAVARTPITAVVMVFEMTGGYSYILPIMLSAAIADLTAEKLGHKPIYSMLIVNRSSKSKEAELLSDLRVKIYMSAPVETVGRIDTIKEAVQKFEASKHKAFPVTDGCGKLCGILTADDVEDAMFQGVPETSPLSIIMNSSPVVISPEDNLYKAYYRLHSNNAEWLVAVDRHNRIKGILTRVDIHRAVSCCVNTDTFVN